MNRRPPRPKRGALTGLRYAPNKLEYNASNHNRQGLIFIDEISRGVVNIKKMYPLLYDLHHQNHSEDLSMWKKYAELHPDSILELGCGTGRILIPLLEKGYRIYGIDKDLYMLSFLLSRLKTENFKRAAIFKADITNFRLARKFSLILLPCNTYSELIKKERLSTLECVSRQLNSDGVFIVSIPNPTMLRELPVHSKPEFEEELFHPDDKTSILISSGWKRTKDRFIVDWYYEHHQKNGKKDIYHAQAKHTLTSLEEYIEEIQDNNLRVERTFGDYRFSPFTPDSDVLILQIRH